MLGQLQVVQIINNDKVPEVLHLQVKDLRKLAPSTPTERS